MPTFSLPTKDGLKFKLKQRAWIGTKSEVATYSGTVVNEAGEKVVQKTLIFKLPKSLEIEKLRLSMTDVALAGEVLLVDETTCTGYADTLDWPANERPNSNDDEA